jgi:MFS family permease
MLVSSACFVSGFLISALGLYLRQYWMVVVGYGFVGGIGLGIGYISPVSTLIKWFPDRARSVHRYRDHGVRRWRADRVTADEPAADGVRRQWPGS